MRILPSPVRCSVAFALSFVVCFSSMARGQEAVSEAPVASEPTPQQTGLGAWPYQPLQSMKRGLSKTLDRQSQLTLAIGAAAVLGATSLDKSAKETFDHQGRIGEAARIGNDYLGTGVPGALLGATFWILGDWNDRPFASHAGQAQLEALFTTGIATAILKGAVNRERPDGSDHFSFPSGHTSTVFTMAAVLGELYGWKAGVPAYLLGAMTAVSRMQENKHWLSDTVGGATLGILIGRAFARSHREHYEELGGEKSTMTIHPVIEPGGGRLVFHWTF